MEPERERKCVSTIVKSVRDAQNKLNSRRDLTKHHFGVELKDIKSNNIYL